ncbi:ubiquitin carboxyl-terminal hydrolase MINDY-1 [Rhodamnia argentea]|uniref:Ubiquitin carboxyl-terminal hydrolase MINDY-1 n=1 Tax=Rhodamnia argentea TaxID=178133 RepID=A0A8B8NS48_9MYRT|nr:ubiquitin carboxyl-terminal hydrolase MINDY-1 [Rhodamnia argentea]XP_048141812.1 ubiquitin carboxyl-terminal hydrolase MINDY-1 [Rhodamnia argentea]XP_048141813.1 ubiquitin carboxyl-terminal hydrolase MINDY-1 [Rhodamnia argentea]XP_048141814.1 ubiquitin carboxyl-terminal hydrolase MINDY-1 [Rhodamnia argentea]
MATSTASPPPSASPSSSTVDEQPRQQDQQPQQQQQQQEQQLHQLQPSNGTEKECIHKTKLIQFLGRSTPIVLQNDNGPCPLLAICNILLLRNSLNLSPDTAEVSQEKLLSLVAERLIDSNSNINNKDAGYVENQQQNIADAIDLLPRLATGIDVNIKFRRIDDFEFTRECAIFDLLDIPLYHGWIVDPQDNDTEIAIGSKSYNTLVGELVALETRMMDQEHKEDSGEDCVDFAAAATAALGVPSPSLSKVSSFDGSPRSVSDTQTPRKGDLEEEAELMRVLKLSEIEGPDSSSNSFIAGNGTCSISCNFDEGSCPQKFVHADALGILQDSSGVENISCQLEPPLMVAGITLTDENHPVIARTCLGEVGPPSLKTDVADHIHQSKHAEIGEAAIQDDLIDLRDVDTSFQVEKASVLSPVKLGGTMDESLSLCLRVNEKVETPTSPVYAVETADYQTGCDAAEFLSVSVPNVDSDSSNGKLQHTDVAEPFTPSIDGSEPIYEGEECILDSGTAACEDREPIYEGEVVLAKQADKAIIDAYNVSSKDEMTPQQGELVRNFLKSSASQLTIYGLFSLQEGLKERELCVFFRNNHFSTMFKYEGQLYLLATDQGYINQPDLVWEKLNEVNGDTLFMTSNFKEFKVESHTNDTWDEHNAMANTADYLASIDRATHAGLDMDSDHQLAIALQQQEFEQQRQPQRSNVQPQSIGGSRLITGPQGGRYGGRNPSSSNRADAKSKDRCTIM